MGKTGNIDLMGRVGNIGLIGKAGNTGPMGKAGNIGLMGKSGNIGLIGKTGNIGLMGKLHNISLMGKAENISFVGKSGRRRGLEPLRKHFQVILQLNLTMYNPVVMRIEHLHPWVGGGEGDDTFSLLCLGEAQLLLCERLCKAVGSLDEHS